MVGRVFVVTTEQLTQYTKMFYVALRGDNFSGLVLAISDSAHHRQGIIATVWRHLLLFGRTCMMFFQATLLLGYAYAHFARSKFSPRTVWIVQLALISIAMLATNVLPQ